MQVENFDEALRDLVRLSSGIDTKTLDNFASERRRWSAAPRLSNRRGWPVVRFNALPVTHTPTVCRRVVCQIGGHAEVREAIAAAAVNVLATRTRAGVLAYGTDADVRAAFERYTITEFDLHTIETKRLRYDSGERGLLRNALAHAIARQFSLILTRRGNADLLAPADPQHAMWIPLQKMVGLLAGTVPSHPELRWREGIGTRLDWADDRMWLLIEPRTVFEGIDDANRAAAADFARERTVRRYNKQLNGLIAFWAEILAGAESDLRALSIGDGIDATFRLSSDTGFSGRSRA